MATASNPTPLSNTEAIHLLEEAIFSIRQLNDNMQHLIAGLQGTPTAFKLILLNETISDTGPMVELLREIQLGLIGQQF